MPVYPPGASVSSGLAPHTLLSAQLVLGLRR